MSDRRLWAKPSCYRLPAPDTQWQAHLSERQVSEFSNLRIGLVGPLPPPAGGMANQTRQLVELLRSEKATVCLVQTNAPYRPAWAGRIPIVRALFRLLPYITALWRMTSRMDVMHVMANSGWSWHLFAAPAIWIGRLRRVPVVVNYRGGEAADFLSRSARLVRLSMSRTALLIVPSGFLERVFEAHHIRATVVPNIVDLERFRPGIATWHGGELRLLVARNLEPLYDNETALRALALVLERYPYAHLTVAGTGPDEVRLRALAQELGVADSVRFTGRLDRDAMADLYRESEVCLNPSLADNMPNSLLEALASGVPVVSSNVGGIPYITQHEVTALLIPPREPAAMAAAVCRLVEDPPLRHRLVEAGLRDVQRYTWKRVAPLLASVYHAARNSQNGGRALAP